MSHSGGVITEERGNHYCGSLTFACVYELSLLLPTTWRHIFLKPIVGLIAQCDLYFSDMVLLIFVHWFMKPTKGVIYPFCTVMVRACVRFEEAHLSAVLPFRHSSWMVCSPRPERDMPFFGGCSIHRLRHQQSLLYPTVVLFICFFEVVQTFSGTFNVFFSLLCLFLCRLNNRFVV